MGVEGEVEAVGQEEGSVGVLGTAAGRVTTRGRRVSETIPGLRYSES